MKTAILFAYYVHHHYTRQKVSGILHAARFEGHWTLAVRQLPETVAELDRILDDLRPEAVLFCQLNRAILQQIVRKSIPCVILGTDAYPDLPLPVVRPDEYAAGEMAAEHFLAQGFEHFGHVTLPIPSPPQFEERRIGFQERLARERFCVDTHYLTGPVDPFQTTPIDPSLVHWLDALPKPCGILACNDGVGAVVVGSCRRRGIDVPGELSIVGIENFPLICQTVHPQLSSIQLPFEEIGRVAAGLFCGRNASTGPACKVWKIAGMELVHRGTTTLHRLGDSLVTRALIFIEQHIEKPFKIADLLRHLGTTAPTLAFHFKQKLGRTAIEEVRRRRIERAKHLLSETDISIGAVAKKSGFNSPVRFNHVFLEFTKLPPGEYRRQSRNT